MSNSTRPEDGQQITPLEYWQENLSAWQDLGRRTGQLWLHQASRLSAKQEPSAEIAETLTAEMLRTVSDFNLRHWQNTARLLDMMPDWMTAPSLLNGTSLTDWFDKVQRARLQDIGFALETVAPADKSALPPEQLQTPSGQPDDLSKIKGIGPKLSQRLNALGIYHFKQIASWTKPQSTWIEAQLASKGRVAREDWVSQARKLSANGSATVH